MKKNFREGFFPVFSSWNKLYLTLLPFNKQRVEEGKKEIENVARYTRIGIKLSWWGKWWCLPDLGDELNKAWDEFCLDNHVIFWRITKTHWRKNP